MTRVLVVGYGSIGQRHVRILERLGSDVAVVSRRPLTDSVHAYSAVPAAVVGFAPEFAIVADETVRHRATLAQLLKAGFRGPVLVEKPIFDSSLPIDGLDRPDVYVGYNLRFSPLVLKLKHWLSERRAISAQFHVGQHLADWRPNRDYRQTYSASATAGGGVLRDLSHELDLALWMFGSLHRVVSLGGNSGVLETMADDHQIILAALSRCPTVAISMNALDRPARRDLHVTTDMGSATIDFIAGTLVAEGLAPVRISVDKDDLYLLQLKAFLGGGNPPLCRYAEGISVLRFIEAAENSVNQETWMKCE